MGWGQRSPQGLSWLDLGGPREARTHGTDEDGRQRCERCSLRSLSAPYPYSPPPLLPSGSKMDVRVTGIAGHSLSDRRDSEISRQVSLHTELVGSEGVEVPGTGAFKPVDLEVASRLEMTTIRGVGHDQIGVVVLQIKMVEGGPA